MAPLVYIEIMALLIVKPVDFLLVLRGYLLGLRVLKVGPGELQRLQDIQMGIVG